MPNQPLVSIIIPTFNRAHLLGETLDSVLSQTYSHWECIVVDDGSTDGTDALMTAYIERDARIQFHKRPDSHLSGGNGARNYGFKVSKGEFIQWFDSDDLMFPRKIELSVSEVINQNVELVISNFNILGQQIKNKKLEFENLLRYHIAYGTINTPMCFIEKKLLNNILFDETLIRGQEFEFFTRLFGNKKINFVIIQESLCSIRLHDDSITSKYMSGQEDYISSLLFAKLSAFKFSLNLDSKTQEIVSKKFEATLWKALIFKHKKLYWKYFKLYSVQSENLMLKKRIKLIVLAMLFFTFKRGSQIIKKQFFAE